LLSNNKLLTRDNLAKRREVNDKIYVFCNEPQNIRHIFFDCCVVNILWNLLSDIFGVQLGGGFEAMAKWWICEKKHTLLNICTSSVLWCIWNLRNVSVFRGTMVGCEEGDAQDSDCVEKMGMSL
jgi:hypothetical protein